jgi:hypothetical protein
MSALVMVGRMAANARRAKRDCPRRKAVGSKRFGGS